MQNQHWCMCEKLKAIARDGQSTCSICEGKDAYGLSNERPDDKKKTITTTSTWYDSKEENKMERIETEVKHSLSKTAWNVVGTQLGRKYKIARVPYFAVEGNEILTTKNKHEALEHALFISKCFNEKYDT